MVVFVKNFNEFFGTEIIDYVCILAVIETAIKHLYGNILNHCSQNTVLELLLDPCIKSFSLPFHVDYSFQIWSSCF